MLYSPELPITMTVPRVSPRRASLAAVDKGTLGAPRPVAWRSWAGECGCHFILLRHVPLLEQYQLPGTR